MYPQYFGLKEASFSITPDPQYLYLSKEHREALAHLVYGAVESGGFVLLTGEVGTGKTTICRAFLEQLPEQVDVALVLHPALTAPELLHTVCDEFGVQLPAEGATTKVLVDRLNSYLLRAHATGRRPVLLIDEAQNLKPEVLEQIRLLTNLETHKHKLLQIFLVGQPELRTLLQQPRLRQLAQRITARYHLLPLSDRETAEYIAHRLAVAGVKRRLFTKAALRRIYRLTDGIPRLINILCDRALLGAFATQRQVVDAGIVAKAARELSGEKHRSTGRGGIGLRWLTAAALLLTAAGGLAYVWEDLWPRQPDARPTAFEAQVPQPDSEPETSAPAAPARPADPAPRMSAATPSERTELPPIDEPPIDETPATPPPAPDPVPPTPVLQPNDRRSAMTHLLASWGLTLPQWQGMTACEFAATQGLRCRQASGGWNKLRFYDRPAVIWLDNENGEQRYLAVIGLSQQQALVAQQNGPLQVPLTRLEDDWSGKFELLWRPPPNGDTLIGSGSRGEIVLWLRKLVSNVPGWPPDDSGSEVFDATLRERIRGFQQQHGLVADGIVGPETLIQLNSAALTVDVPRLQTLP